MTVKSSLVILGGGGVVGVFKGLCRKDALNVCSCGLMLEDRAIKVLQQCFIEQLSLDWEMPNVEAKTLQQMQTSLFVCVKNICSLIELSRDITEISPLWELLPFNLS